MTIEKIMHFVYFDENKHSWENPYFFIGGVIIEDKKIVTVESSISQIQYNFFGTTILCKETEFHGKEIFHGKGIFKGRNLTDRIKIFEDVSSVIAGNQLPIKIVCIDVNAHQAKYRYPRPEYGLGLMLFLERCCDFLDTKGDCGMVFGDYEKDEITNSILDFSQFKFLGKTPMYFGRPLGRIIDTVYFTHSHHSRLLQIADLVIYLAGRYENQRDTSVKWHEIQAKRIWDYIKANVDIYIQHWP